MKLSRFSVNNSVAVNLLMWLIIIGGLYKAFTLRKELFPDFEPEQISLRVVVPGTSPEELEDSVTRRFEREIRDVDGVRRMTSRITEGLSSTIIEVQRGFDRQDVLNDLRGEVDRVTPELPSDAEEPELNLVRPYFPVISVVVHGPVDEHRLEATATKVKDDLLDLPGINRVQMTGRRRREIHITVLPQKLEEYGLTFESVGQVLQGLNIDAPGGTLEGDRGNVGVRTVGERDRALLIEQFVVKSAADGPALRLGDIARVEETFEDRVESGSFAGEPAVLLTVFKAPEEDALRIAATVKDFVASRGKRRGGALTMNTVTDLSRFIAQRLDLMLRNARWGLLLVVLALALFLEIRVAFWVALGMPISFLGTFVLMDWMGASINLLSLFGLIVVLGLIVDDAIVIGENVFARRRAGMSSREAAILGAGEVTIPVVAAVLTTMAAFMPLAFIAGDIGAFMKELPIVVIAALSISLIEALVILPAHLAHLKTAAGGRTASGLGGAMRRFRHAVFEEGLPRFYRRSLRFALRWRYVSLAVALAFSLVVLGLVAGGVVPFVLLQETDAETLVVDLEMASGTPEARTREVLQGIEARIQEMPETKSAFAVVGASFSDRGRVDAADPATVGQITVELLPAEEREDRGLRSAQRILADLRETTPPEAGVTRLHFAARSGGPQGPDIEVLVRGEDVETLRQGVAWVEEQLETYSGVVEVEDDLVLGKPEIRLQLNPVGRALGLDTRTLASQVRHALFGFEVQELQEQDEAVKVRVLLPKSARRTPADLADLRIQTPSGGRAPLEEVARLSVSRSYASIAHVDEQRAVTIRAEVDEDKGNVNAITGDLTRKVEDIGKRFPGLGVAFEGRKKQTRESLSSLKVGFPIALFLIYAIIAILFRSYTQPLIVMAAIPYSLVGAIVGHYISGYPFTILSLIGGVALAGIVVNDSLILVDLVNKKHREGEGLFDAVISGGTGRLRPIILTSITTIAGLAPLMLERSFQAQFLIPMAVSIVYGLAFGTVLTLYILPCLYLVLHDFHRVLRGGVRG
ncbi:MAG TPA: efflux RND transporter permease subunit [Planctomycetes bacterium]|nr:efflux RND transporter permease subunit [Planctomycetota bacterium]